MSPRSSPQEEQRTWPRLRRKRSIAWRFFSESPADPNCAVCQLCNAAIPRGRRLARNTTNLLKHLRNKHPNRLSAVLAPGATSWSVPRDSASSAVETSAGAQECIAGTGGSVHAQGGLRTSLVQGIGPDHTLRHAVVQLAIHGIALSSLGEPIKVLQERVVSPLVAETSTQVQVSLSTIEQVCSLVVTRAGTYSLVRCYWISGTSEFRRRAVCLAVIPPGVSPSRQEIQNIAKSWGILEKVSCILFGSLSDYIQNCTPYSATERFQEPQEHGFNFGTRACDTGGLGRPKEETVCNPRENFEYPQTTSPLDPIACTEIGMHADPNAGSFDASALPIALPALDPSEEQANDSGGRQPPHADGQLYVAYSTRDGINSYGTPSLQLGAQFGLSSAACSSFPLTGRPAGVCDIPTSAQAIVSERRSSETDSHSFSVPKGTGSSLSSVIPLSECPSTSQSPPLSPSEPRDKSHMRKNHHDQDHSNLRLRGLVRTQQAYGAPNSVAEEAVPSMRIGLASRFRNRSVPSRLHENAVQRRLHAASDLLLCSSAALDRALNDGLLKTWFFRDSVSRVRTAVRLAMESFDVYESHCQSLLMGTCIPLVLDDGDGGYVRSLHNMLVRFQGQFHAVKATFLEVSPTECRGSLEALNLSDLSVFTTVLVIFMDAFRVMHSPVQNSEGNVGQHISDNTASLSVCIPTIKGVKRALGKLRVEAGLRMPTTEVLDGLLGFVDSLLRDIENRDAYSGATLLDPRLKSSAFDSSEAACRARDHLFQALEKIQSETCSVMPHPCQPQNFGSVSYPQRNEDKPWEAIPNMRFESRSPSAGTQFPDYTQNLDASGIETRSISSCGVVSCARKSLGMYLAEPACPFSTDVFDYWREASRRWPILASAAAAFLATPASSSAPCGSEPSGVEPTQVEPSSAFGAEDAVQMMFLRENALCGTRVA